MFRGPGGRATLPAVTGTDMPLTASGVSLNRCHIVTFENFAGGVERDVGIVPEHSIAVLGAAERSLGSGASIRRAQ
jgi:hypothetical protein